MKKLKIILLLVCPLIFTCNQAENQNGSDTSKEENVAEAKTYGNERFKNVKAEEISENTYRITGQAQVFEATLNYVVEDGHYELANGYATTDAGAPEFGNFDFNITVKKRQPNSTLMLILFESSPKDGSRTHELIIPLATNEAIQ